MAFLSIIRRWHKRDHEPIREISRRTGVSRNTIRKYLRSDVIEPKFQVLDRPSKLDPYAEKLSAWLRREAGRPRKQRRTVKQLCGESRRIGNGAAQTSGVLAENLLDRLGIKALDRKSVV